MRIAGLNVANVGTEYLLNDLQLKNKKVYFTVMKTGENKEVLDADIHYRKVANFEEEIADKIIEFFVFFLHEFISTTILP